MATMQWSISADGGYMANTLLSKKLRYAAQPLMKFRGYARPVDGFGKGQGDSLDYNKLSNVATAGGQIGETQRIPVTKFAIRRGTLTIAEYGNSIEWTGKLDVLSAFDLSDPLQRGLRNDMAKTLDIQTAAECKKTKIAYITESVSSGRFDTDGTPSGAAATDNLNLFHLKEMVDYMITNNVPPAIGGEDGDYVMVATRKALRGIVDDPEFQEWVKYTEGEKKLNGELGRVPLYRTRIVETTHYNALSNTKGANSIGEAIMLGDDAVVEGVAVPEELRSKIPDDYGRVKGIAWYALLGWKHVWDFATDNEFRAIYFTSP